MASNFSSLTERSDINALADLFEIFSIKNKRASKRDIESYLGILSDNDENIGIDDNDSERANTLDDVLIELENRKRNSKNHYPFTLDATGSILTYIPPENSNHPYWCYLYLLLSTNINMRDNKILDGIDGTLLLEKLSAEILSNYLGAHSKAFVFGTSMRGSFRDKVDYLCQSIGEGRGYDVGREYNIDRDGKLDTVGWIPFSDNRLSKLIVFGQCKTGTNWKSTLSQLQPEAFIRKFIQGHFAFTPLRSFFISESIDSSKWKDNAIDAGLFFDRCRIAEYCPETLSDNLFFNDMKNWTQLAIERVDL